MAEAQLSLVNIWTDPEPGSGGFNPMASSMLWLPKGLQPGHAVPAFIYVHRWGGYPYDPMPSSIGPLLAAQGCLLLSLCLRRRGMEGQLMAVPDNDHRDIKLAIDYLHTNGYGPVHLVGEEIGAISALNYMKVHKDSRVKGLTLLDPVAEPSSWLRGAMGEEDYLERIGFAGIAARQGAGMDTRIDIFAAERPSITQQAAPFLSWWGPQTALMPADLTSQLAGPVDIDSANLALLPAAYDGLPSLQLDSSGQPELLAEHLVERVAAGGAVASRPTLEMVHAQSGPEELFGFLWESPDGNNSQTAILLVHGLTSSPLSPLFLTMAPLLAQHNVAVLANEMRRSGWAGHETALLEYDAEDIDAWVKFLLERGYQRIVLAGASIGSISVGRYQSVVAHPNVVALAHLMPTADCADWFRRGVGDAVYADTVKQAENAVADGRGDVELIDVDLRQPPPNKYGGRFRWTQRAASWLSWWGPEADSVNSIHIANARIPLLLLSGTEDSYNDEARFAQLKAAATNAPSVDEIWYPGIDHGLVGVETQVAKDLCAWLQKVGAL